MLNVCTGGGVQKPIRSLAALKYNEILVWAQFIPLSSVFRFKSLAKLKSTVRLLCP